MKIAKVYYLITLRATEEEGLQGTIPVVILEINEACGPRDNLQLGQVENRKLHWEGVFHVAKLGENCQSMVDSNL